MVTATTAVIVGKLFKYQLGAAFFHQVATYTLYWVGSIQNSSKGKAMWTADPSNEKEEQQNKFLILLFCLSLSHKHTALLGSSKNKLWIGLVLDQEHGWQWTNGKPFRYLRWTEGKCSLSPTSEPFRHLLKSKKTIQFESSIVNSPQSRYFVYNIKSFGFF